MSICYDSKRIYTACTHIFLISRWEWSKWQYQARSVCSIGVQQSTKCYLNQSMRLLQIRMHKGRYCWHHYFDNKLYRLHETEIRKINQWTAVNDWAIMWHMHSTSSNLFNGLCKQNVLPQCASLLKYNSTKLSILYKMRQVLQHWSFNCLSQPLSSMRDHLQR